MTPTCHFCAQTPMVPQKFHVLAGNASTTGLHVVIYACPQCHRIAPEKAD